MDFTNLFVNQPIVTKLLKNEFEQNRLVHLYLFSGQKGSLEMDAAVYFASLVLCDEGGNCGKCQECLNLSKFNNPHLYVLTPQNDMIKKDQISELEREFSYTTDHTRVFIIQDIEKANLTASNNLLKFLEELPDNTYGILLTENYKMVIPTIISRCQVVRFLPLSKKNLSEGLEKRGIDSEKSEVIAQISSNVSDAINNAKNPEVSKMIEIVKKINEAVERENNGYLEYEKENEFIKGLDRKNQKLFLELLIMIQRDKINYMLNRKDHICFLKTLEFSNIGLSGKEELQILEVLLKFRQRLDSYANVEIVFTQMFVEIGKVIE